MTVPASGAADSLGGLHNGIRPHWVRSTRFAASLIEMRHGPTTESGVLAPQLRFERTVTTEEKHRAFQLRPPFSIAFQPVPGDEQVVSLLVAEHFDPDEFAGDDDGMGAVGNEILDALKPGNC